MAGEQLWGRNYKGSRRVSISLTLDAETDRLNEFGLDSRTESYVVSPLHNKTDDSSDKLKAQELYPPSLLPNYDPDVLFSGLGVSLYRVGVIPTEAARQFRYLLGRARSAICLGGYRNVDEGRHSFKFDGEIQWTKSYQEINSSISFGTSNITSLTSLTGASDNFPNSGLVMGSSLAPTYALPGLTGSQTGGMAGSMYSMLNMSAGSVGSVGQYFYINSPTAMSYNDVTKGEDLWITDYRQNMFNLFIKDDWKVKVSLTLHLVLRYEWF